MNCSLLCHAVGWCLWLLRDAGCSPSSLPGGESRTASPWRSTGKEPPHHQRRSTARSDWSWSSTWGYKKINSCYIITIFKDLLPSTGSKITSILSPIKHNKIITHFFAYYIDYERVALQLRYLYSVNEHSLLLVSYPPNTTEISTLPTMQNLIF